MRLPITDTVDIYHQKRTVNTEAYEVIPTYSNINACISPTGTDIQTSGDVPAFQAFEIYLYDVTLNIASGDKLITYKGTKYLVSGIPYVVNNTYMRYIRLLAHQIF